MAERVVTQSQNGTRVTASRGDVIVVRLPENPTTGYRWNVDEAGGLALLDDRFTAMSDALGAGGERELRFSAAVPGLSLIELTLRRAWEVGAASQARFQLSVDVR